MAVTREYIEYVVDQLRDLGSVRSKRMFGGAGLYHNGVFFALVADDVLYFKVNDADRQVYIDAGSEPFKPFGSYAMGYYEVPADVLEDPRELSIWAGRALAAAMMSNTTGKRKRSPGTGKKA